MSYSIRTHLREWKVETRERSWKTGKDRSVAGGGAEIGMSRIKRDLPTQHNLEELLAECRMESMEKAVAAALK